MKVIGLTITILTGLFALIFPCLVNAAVAIKEMHFNDPAFANCVYSAAEKNHWENAEQVTKLKCHSMAIVDAQEVINFTNLQFLSLYNNQLSQLNISQLINLEELNLANNQLTSLQIHDLKRLKKLYLFRNQLKTLNLTGLSQLHTVRLMQNQLELLDISPLVKLKTGYFFDNKLKDLAITGLKELEFLDVRQNPMPDELYDFYDQQEGIVISHDGNADDWK